MAVPAGDALLERPWPVGVVLKQLGAVLRLDDGDLALANALMDIPGGVAEIREPGDGAARREKIPVMATGETKSDRLLRIMRHGKTLDEEIAKHETRAGLKNLPLGPVFKTRLHGA